MSALKTEATGPDFTRGVPLTDLPAEGTLAGRVGDDPVFLSRRGGEFFAVSALCTHYGAHLANGLIAGDEVHCPWHHACFSLRTGVALAAPAFDALDRWRVEIEGERVFVRARINQPIVPMKTGRKSVHPKRVVIIGGGAAGFAAADRLRRLGFEGELSMLSADASPPCDRPNLSKDYLAGTAPEEWIPLKGEDFYRERSIDLRLETEVIEIGVQTREVITASGERFAFDALLLATGAEPIRLPTPGFNLPNVHVLRSLADARALIASVQKAGSAATIGASFIGLEVAAALRARGLDVHVIAPEDVPMKRVLGEEIGAFVRALHEENGVHFHLGQTGVQFDGRRLTLSGGGAVDVDLVVQGVGVQPRVELAAAAGIAVAKGVVVDEHLQTSVAGIFAAGDLARYPDARTGELVRVEHWVAAERQGQSAAANMLGANAIFSAPPFFWSKHYGRTIRYVGHAPNWARMAVDGSIAAGDFTARYFRGDRLLAAASVGRDLENLEIEASMAQELETASA